MARARPHTLACAVLGAGWLVVACAPPAGDGDADDDEGSGSESGSDEGGLAAAQADDVCEDAPVLSTGRWPGNLRGAGADLGGACGLGGPDAFIRVAPAHAFDLRVQARGVGFTPRLGVLPSACVAGRELACTEDLPLTVTDLAAGTELVVSVGIDPDDPALQTPAPPDGEGDPLAFEVEVVVRRILQEGEYCMPVSQGRCGTGLACLADADDQAFRCEALPADTCGSAQPFSLPATTLMPVLLEIDPSQLQTDAHRHSCTGARLRERVLRLALSPETSLTAALHVDVDDPRVGLAMRAPGCAAEHEFACEAPGAGQSAIFSEAGVAAAAGTEPFLFVELPDAPAEGEPADPIVLAFEVVDG